MNKTNLILQNEHEAGMEFEEYKDDLPELSEDNQQQPIPANRPVLEDLRSGRKYPIPTYPMFIGREKLSSICVPVPAVSRKHAKVFEREGAFYIQDMGSINGTFLNDKRIIDPVALKEGDRVKVGVTKKFPKGAREYLFKSNVSEEEKLEQQKKEERDRILKEVGVSGGAPVESKKIMLRHCIFQVTKQEFIALLKLNESHRVPLIKLDLEHSYLSFLDMTAFKPKDSVMFSIAHPRLPEPIKLQLRIITAEAKNVYGVIEHKAMIIKVADKHKSLLENMIVLSDLICYLTSRRLTESPSPKEGV